MSSKDRRSASPRRSLDKTENWAALKSTVPSNVYRRIVDLLEPLEYGHYFLRDLVATRQVSRFKADDTLGLALLVLLIRDMGKHHWQYGVHMAHLGQLWIRCHALGYDISPKLLYDSAAMQAEMVYSDRLLMMIMMITFQPRAIQRQRKRLAIYLMIALKCDMPILEALDYTCFDVPTSNWYLAFSRQCPKLTQLEWDTIQHPLRQRIFHVDGVLEYHWHSMAVADHPALGQVRSDCIWALLTADGDEQTVRRIVQQHDQILHNLGLGLNRAAPPALNWAALANPDSCVSCGTPRPTRSQTRRLKWAVLNSKTDAQLCTDCSCFPLTF